MRKKTKRFLGIDFWNGSAQDLLQEADADGGLFTVPSAPSLAQMRKDSTLTKAYQSSDWAVVDGGYVALVLRLLLGHNLPRISGLQLLQRLIGMKEDRAIPFHDRKVLWVVPTPAEQKRIEQYLDENGFPEDKRSWYYAPHYKVDKDFEDQALAAKVNEAMPDWIVLCIGGGKQEKLGFFLRSIGAGTSAATDSANGAATADSDTPASRTKGPVILCTGGAIAFLTGGQAKIPTWADRMYLGWFLRIVRDPGTFLPRYWNAGWEFPWLLWERRRALFVER